MKACFTILACALALPAAAMACEKDGKRKTVVIKTIGGDHKSHAMHGKCAGVVDVDVDETRKDADGELRRERIVICNDREAISAHVVESLEKAKAGIASNDALSDAMRDKVIAGLDAAIARHRAK